MSAPRVVYVGNFEPENSTETHYAVSFEALGCEVARIQENAADIDARVLTAVAEGADLLLYTRTWNSIGNLTAHMLEDPPDRLITAAVHLDVWWDLDRADEILQSPMFRAQHVFTADGRYPEKWEAAGINHHWLPPAVVDLDLVGETLGTPDPDRWPFDVAFIGSRHYHPEWPFRPALIDHLADQYGDRFAHVGGDGTVRGSGGLAMRGQELNDFYATVPVVVGDSCFASREVSYWSDRAYEAPGRGALQVFPWIDFVYKELQWAQGDQFHLAQNYYTPNDLDAVGACVDWALSALTPAERHQRAVDTVTWMKEHATYTQRAQTILETVGLA